MEDLNLAELVKIARRKNTEGIKAYKELYTRYSTKIRYHIKDKLGRDNPEEDDLVQEVFAEAYDRLDKLLYDEAFPAWLLGIARGKVGNYLRTKIKEGEILTPLGDGYDLEAPSCPYSETDIKEFFTYIRRGFGKLSSQQKLVWLLNWEGLRPKQISQSTSISHDVVRTQLLRAKQKIWSSTRHYCKHSELHLLIACTIVYYPSIWEELYCLLERKNKDG